MENKRKTTGQHRATAAALRLVFFLITGYNGIKQTYETEEGLYGHQSFNPGNRQGGFA